MSSKWSKIQAHGVVSAIEEMDQDEWAEVIAEGFDAARLAGKAERNADFDEALDLVDTMLSEGWVDGWRERAIELVNKCESKKKGG